MEGSTQAEPKRLAFGAAALRSGLVSPKQFQRASELAEEKNDAAVAAVLVRSGLITQYQAQQLQAGRSKLTLGPYLITDWIGQGGMGQVFKAVHNVMGRECAVKVLPLEKSTPESRDAFRREIRVQAGLDSPFGVRAFDAGHAGKEAAGAFDLGFFDLPQFQARHTAFGFRCEADMPDLAFLKRDRPIRIIHPCPPARRNGPA